MSDSVFTTSQKLAAIDREIATRKRVFRDALREGNSFAAQEVEVMISIARDYRMQLIVEADPEYRRGRTQRVTP